MVAKSAGRVRLVEEKVCTGSVEIWDANEWIGAPAEGNEEWSSRLLSGTISGFIDAPSNMSETTAYVRGNGSICQNFLLIKSKSTYAECPLIITFPII